MKVFVWIVAICGMLSAGVEEGKTVYQSLCKGCHGDGKVGCFMRTQSGWGDEFAVDAKMLKSEHKENSKAKEIFASEKFVSAKQNLFEFLKEYASDSGNVAGCGSSCD
jgi:hypothetical protein